MVLGRSAISSDFLGVVFLFLLVFLMRSAFRLEVENVLIVVKLEERALGGIALLVVEEGRKRLLLLSQPF